MSHISYALTEALNSFPYVVMKGGTPTYANPRVNDSGALDLVLMSPRLACNSDVAVLDETYSSNHFPVLTRIFLSPCMVVPNSSRFHLTKVEWGTFVSSFNDREAALVQTLESCEHVTDAYGEFVETIQASLITAGVLPPCNVPVHSSRIKPYCWKKEGTNGVQARSAARRAYLRNQSADALEEYLKLDGETEQFLRKQKTASYRDFCVTINPNMGSRKIYH